MDALRAIRGAIKTEEFDYGSLMQNLNLYKKPRDVVTRLLKKGVLIRVKKGLYVFGTEYRKERICKESLANLIYGPSYISLEYALSYYGLIPERVEYMTSMTPLRSKIFKTPLGIFEYEHLHPCKVAVGTTLGKISKRYFFMATAEKALADRVATHKNLVSIEELYTFLCQGLRIEEESLTQLQLPSLQNIANIYKNPAVTCLAHLIKELL